MNNIDQENVQQLEGEGIDIKGWLLRILSIWPFIILSLSVCLVIAYFKLKAIEPLFRVASIILVKDERRGGGGGLDNSIINQLGVGKGVLIDNEIEILRSYDLMKEVVEQTQLYLTVKHEGRISQHTLYGNELPFVWEFANPGEIYSAMNWVLFKKDEKWMLQTVAEGRASELKMGKWYIINGLKFKLLPNTNAGAEKVDWGHYKIMISPIEAVTGYYKGALSVGAVNEYAALISLSLTDNHPVKARDALNTLLDAYNKMGMNDKNLVTENTMDFLTNRLEAVGKELGEVEEQVEKFKTENEITEISANARQYMSDANIIDKQKVVEESQIFIIDELEKELYLNKGNPRMVPSTLGIVDPVVGGLISQHNDLVLKAERMKTKATSINPALIDLENQIENVRIALIENIKNLRNSYKIELNTLERRNGELNSQIKRMPLLERQLLQITRDQGVKEQLYLFLLQKKEEAAVTLASSIPDIREIEKVRILGQVGPDRRKFWGVAWVIGILLPIGGLLVIDFLNSKVGSQKEVEQKTRVPLLGDLAFVKNLDNPIPVLKKGRSVITEQFRGLRTAISYTGKGKKVRSILVTSQRPGEGKSFTSLNLAGSYALLNQKVVVLEFDMRKPRVARNLGFHPHLGISTYLSQDVDLDDLLIEIPNYKGGNFFLLPAGPIPPNPAELILGDNMNKLMKELEDRFDFIIIDTPPFSVVTDAKLLQSFAQISIVVIRQGYSHKSVYEDLNRRMSQYPDEPIYAVLNGVGRTQRYGSYGYGYGYGYYDDVNQKKKFWQKKTNTS